MITEKSDHLKLKFVSLPCSGKVNLLYLLKAFETGTDGIILVSCEMGKCKYLQGNMRAKKRIEAINDLLIESGLEKDLIRIIIKSDQDIKKELFTQINELAERIKLKEVHQ